MLTLNYNWNFKGFERKSTRNEQKIQILALYTNLSERIYEQPAPFLVVLRVLEVVAATLLHRWQHLDQQPRAQFM